MNSEGANDSESIDPMKARAPDKLTNDMVIGYNHDIPYRGRVYHVQTEHSGRERRWIVTHVFHAGIIVASNRVDYADTVRAPSIVALMRASHKSMMTKLLKGELDEAIVRRLSETQPSQLAVLASPLGAPDGLQMTLRRQRLIEALDMDEIKRILQSLYTNVTGTLGVALVDYESGICLGTVGTGLNVDVAAAGNMEVMKAKSKVMHELGIKGGIEDILITLESQYHIIRPVGSALFLYLAVDRKQGNLAMARHKLNAAAAEVQV